jgi:hypothetical protein
MNEKQDGKVHLMVTSLCACECACESPKFLLATNTTGLNTSGLAIGLTTAARPILAANLKVVRSIMELERTE